MVALSNINGSKMDGINSAKQFNRAKGRWGEAAAVVDLEAHGFAIVCMNFLCKAGEIDIIARKSGIIHFVEVKARANSAFGIGREAVTPKKQQSIRRAAKFYLLQEKLLDEVNCCFDVIEITGFEHDYSLVHLENCF